MLTFLTLVIPILFTAPLHPQDQVLQLTSGVSVSLPCQVLRSASPGLYLAPLFFTSPVILDFIGAFVPVTPPTVVALRTATDLISALSKLLGQILIILFLIIPGPPILVFGFVAARSISSGVSLPLLILLIILTFNFEDYYV